jgi:hypothetical protein
MPVVLMLAFAIAVVTDALLGGGIRVVRRLRGDGQG